MLQLVVARRGRDEDGISHVPLELLEAQRAVVKTAGQPKAVVDQALLSGPIAVVHGPQLGQGLVALIYHQQKVLREVVDQAVGGLSGPAAVEVAGVVLDSLATARLGYHLHVVLGPLAQPVRLQSPQLRQPLLHLRPDALQGSLLLLLRDDIMPGGVDEEVAHILFDPPGEPVHLRDPLHLISEQLDSDDVVVVARHQVDGVTLDPEPARRQIDVVSLKENVHQPA